MLEKKAYEEAIERVGRTLYGSLWIGELQKREWDNRRKNGADYHPTANLPSSGKLAARIAKEHFRYRASKEQYDQVYAWLKQEGLFNSDFSFASRFDAWFRKKFPQAPLSSSEKRRRAVRAALKAGQRPGHGGNTDWKSFCKDIENRTGLSFDEKTIQRDVNELRGK